MNKQYLGDSVYIETLDGGTVRLTTENGLASDPSNEIIMERSVIDAFHRYVSPVTVNLPLGSQEICPSISEIEEQVKKINAASKAIAKMLELLAGYEGKKQFGIYAENIDFNYFSHEEIVSLMKHLRGGKWEKKLSYDNKSIDYTNTTLIPGFTVRFWSAAPPPSCRIVVEEVDIPAVVTTVPARKEKRFRMICTEENTTNENNQ